MSKKNKFKNFKKKQNKKYNNLSDMFNSNNVEQDDGFNHLAYTLEGEKRINKIRQRLSSKVFKDVKEVKDELVRGYDSSEFSENLNDVEDFVKNGKYKKAEKASDKKLLNGFLTEYAKITEDSPNWEKMNTLAKKVITIGKSFFEYCSDPELEYISDESYDGLLAKFLKTDGAVEPIGIIPKGLKNQKKVDIKYNSLHNNMDKAYVLMSDDEVPEGVKESDSVEAFLWRAYKTLGFEANQEIEIELSPKIDGVSVNATMSGTAIIEPQTRGDKDESIAILGLDNTIVTKAALVDNDFGIQYEVFVTDEDRDAVSKYLELDRPYVSNRHAASGIIHRLSTASDDELINFISLYPINSEGLDGTYLERMDLLQNYGLVPKDMIDRKVIKGDFKELIKSIRKYYAKLEKVRANLSYAIDGMVITIADDEFQNKIGRNGRTNKYQIAYKFDPSTAIGIVAGIHLDTGKKGYRTVQVDLEEPVMINGVKYPHVPVATAVMFEEMDLHKGDKVKIHRVGDVIPAMSVYERGEGKKIKIPSTCPDCGDRLIVHKKRYYCDNQACPGNIAGRFVNFFEKMGLTGYGVAFAEALHDEYGCKTLADVLFLSKAYLEDKGVTNKQFLEFPAALKAAIGKKKDYEVLGAMGIPGVAAEKAKIILDEMAFRDFLDVHGNITYSVALKAVGAEQASTVANYLADPTFKEEMKAISQYVKMFSKKGEKAIRVGHTGGDLSDEVKDICEMNDFDIVDGNNFDILITTDYYSDSTKMQRAKKMGLPIYMEDKFIKRYRINLMSPETMVKQMKQFNILQGGLSYDTGNKIWYILQMLEAIVRFAIEHYNREKEKV